jgi:membrane protease YdiL (CAAX protease family)
VLERLQQTIRWKLFFTLLAASLFGTCAVLPYVLTSDVLESLPVPLWVLVCGQLVQSAVLFAFCIFVGLLLARRTGLGAPVLEDFFDGKPIGVGRVQQLLKIGLACGAIVGVAIVVVDAACFAQVALALVESLKPSVWKGFLASFYGGICEEILMRLFLMTVLCWLFLKIHKSSLSIWAAIIVTSVAFGLGHLPITASLVSLSPAVVARALILNGIAGVAFGWLYWKKGLETAMIAHFTTDIVLHVVAVALILG